MVLQNQNPQKHIYLADDDSDDRSMFAEVLLELDNSIVLTEAQNGQELMDILNTDSYPLPEVIFLDINMPIKNGFECLKEIRDNRGGLQKISIVMFTTSSDPSTMAKAFELGANFYAIKPNTFNGLRSLASDILKIDWISPKFNIKNISAQLLSPIHA